MVFQQKERSNNPSIAAMQDLAAEETPEERAENFKNSVSRFFNFFLLLFSKFVSKKKKKKGNECLQHGGEKWWNDAIEYYTRAIQCGSRDYPKGELQ